LASLDAIAEFAHRIKSGFAEAFELAAWTLRSTDALELVSPATRDARLKTLSDKAREVLAQRLPICDDLAAVGFGAQELQGLLACDMASVFGSMGSWNDEVPPEALQSEYQALSASLFESVERLRMSII
jgi:hypothetical protein